MFDNVKLDVAIEILSTKLALCANSNQMDKIDELLILRNRMYDLDDDAIEYIINKISTEIKITPSNETEIKNESLDEIKKKYKLSDEEYNEKYNLIKKIFFKGKTSMNRPIAIIVGGQTGAGKGLLISNGKKQFEDDNVIIINSDEFKPFHPKASEIAEKYSTYFTKVTDQETNTWTSNLFDEAIQNKYNIIFEGTMKNTRIISTIQKLQENGYEVIVKALAVPFPDSLTAIHERYEEQLQTKGWGRLVTIEHHDESYNGMPKTINEIEKQEAFDELDIYSKDFNNNLSLEYKHIKNEKTNNVYDSAEDAIMQIRNEKMNKIIDNIKIRIDKLQQIWKNKTLSEDEKKQISSLLERINKFD